MDLKKEIYAAVTAASEKENLGLKPEVIKEFTEEAFEGTMKTVDALEVKLDDYSITARYEKDDSKDKEGFHLNSEVTKDGKVIGRPIKAVTKSKKLPIVLDFRKKGKA